MELYFKVHIHLHGVRRVSDSSLYFKSDLSSVRRFLIMHGAKTQESRPQLHSLQPAVHYANRAASAELYWCTKLNLVSGVK